MMRQTDEKKAKLKCKRDVQLYSIRTKRKRKETNDLREYQLNSTEAKDAINVLPNAKNSRRHKWRSKKTKERKTDERENQVSCSNIHMAGLLFYLLLSCFSSFSFSSNKEHLLFLSVIDQSPITKEHSTTEWTYEPKQRKSKKKKLEKKAKRTMNQQSQIRKSKKQRALKRIDEGQ